jgi:GNAT superfamily N-acetyltransferase
MTNPRPPVPAGIDIRPMRSGDVAAGVALVRASRWNQTAREWHLFLEIAPRGALVAERDGRVVGTAVTAPYSPGTAWVAMVLVDPAERGLGIGRALLLRAIANAPGGYTLRLDATAAGRALYRTLGFEDEGTLSRWRCASHVAAVAGAVARPCAADDWARVADTDRLVFGADRRRVLEWCRDGAPDFAWVVGGGPNSEQRMEGYAFGRHGHDTDHIGPVVASSSDGAAALVDACLSRAARAGVSIDVPDEQVAFGRWLRGLGFEVERSFTRMRRGRAVEPVFSPRVFASVGPEFG